MQIYTGNAVGEKLKLVKEHKCGIMIASSPAFKPRKEFAEVPCALDNGAFMAWKKGEKNLSRHYNRQRRGWCSDGMKKAPPKRGW